MSLFEFVEALHRVHTAKKVTAMQISMRLQQKLENVAGDISDFIAG